MSDLLKLIAPGVGSGKGGQTTTQDLNVTGDPANALPSQIKGQPGQPPQPGQPSHAAAMMPIMDPQSWTKAGTGNFMPGQSNKGGMMNSMGGPLGGGSQ